jgi:two-component system sensor histidine kinase KdpD
MWSRTTGNAAIIQRDGTVHVHSPGPDESASRALGARDALALMLPLRTHDRVVGVLRVERDAGLRLDRSGWRFLDAMSYYAALAVERVRLVAEAERTEALRETNRLKDALLASVSHDLRTPLTSIKALAHDLAALGDERAEMIENEADRLNQTVADLLALSQLNAGVLPVKVELNAVDELVGALLERVEPVIGASRIRVSLPPGDPLLMGNFDLVHSVRILANLVENSARYAPADTTIEVDVSREGDSLLFRVSDRGPGIDRSRVAQMFEPFQRNDGGFRGDGGAGLGLSIARRLAEVQSGNLTYAPRLGGGSVFTLTLPAADLTGETPTALRERPTPESL